MHGHMNVKKTNWNCSSQLQFCYCHSVRDGNVCVCVWDAKQRSSCSQTVRTFTPVGQNVLCFGHKV
jgi:hypothetical protein